VTTQIQRTAELLKVDRRLGIAFGFAIVCKEVDGEGKAQDYYDLHGDHVSEEELMKAATEFAKAERIGKAQHEGDKVADVLFIFPLTEDIAKGLGVTAPRYGLIIGFRPHNAQVLDDIEKGVYRGFSFGGEGVRQEVAA
jgi:hypothetical protein